MTEKEYTQVSDLSHIKDAEDCLRFIMPDSSDVIENDEFDYVTRKLAQWRLKLHQQIKIDER